MEHRHPANVAEGKEQTVPRFAQAWGRESLRSNRVLMTYSTAEVREFELHRLPSVGGWEDCATEDGAGLLWWQGGGR